MIGILALVGGLFLVWVVAKAAVNSGGKKELQLVSGACVACGYTGQLVVLRSQNNLAACINCANQHARGIGQREHWADLPPGHIIGTCRHCDAKAQVMFIKPSEGGVRDASGWLCGGCVKGFLTAIDEEVARLELAAGVESDGH